eukprot:CAMPEP_0204826840 /NCGR_PEP_ID=MMETSP1346-20131115/4456_1 /ASSEMBLY_ACC=CAM_ASM_000771 /TAXON_ID=215587 /ORGANISM="Aplanochytrium stocchinoi, Strain GSBS06" /LENGTH=614 /DNA_ID=CAMNT_0051955047 /DNA_START=133 /DNA_END=1977 /DNA_ORIENTATION=+
MAILPFLKAKPTPLVAVTFAIPYLCFVFAAFFEMSGVLSLVPLGLIVHSYGRGIIVGVVEERMHHFWDETEFIANSILFAIAGLVVSKEIYTGNIAAETWGYLALLYVVLLAVRAITILLLFPIIRLLGYGMSWQEAVFTWWGGLRGAVGLTLALSIRATPGVTPSQGGLVAFFMAGIVVLTLCINAPLSRPLLRKLRLQDIPSERIRTKIEEQMFDSAIQSLRIAGVDTVIIEKEKKEFIEIKHPHISLSTNNASEVSEGDQKKASECTELEIKSIRETPNVPLERKNESESDLEQRDAKTEGCECGSSIAVVEKEAQDRVEIDMEILADKRRHFLLAQQAIYSRILDEGLISASAWFLLNKSVDIELDTHHDKIDQWKNVIGYRFYGGLLQSMLGNEQFLPIYKALMPGRETATGKGIDKLSPCCYSEWAVKVVAYVAYGYIYAHRQAREALGQFHQEFSSNTNDQNQDTYAGERERVRDESLKSCVQPAHVLDVIKKTIPRILSDVKTKHLSQAVKWQLSSKVLHMFETGLIEENELQELLEAADHIGQVVGRVKTKLVDFTPIRPGDNFESHADLAPFIRHSKQSVSDENLHDLFFRCAHLKTRNEKKYI